MVAHPDDFSTESQYVIAVGFSFFVTRGLLLVFDRLRIKEPPVHGDWFYYPPVLALAALWGRHNFINFFYYDEFSRFHEIDLPLLLRVDRLLFYPVNDHFQPVLKIVWLVVYPLFGGNYFGVAATAFVLGATVVVSTQTLLRQATRTGTYGLITMLATFVLAGTAHNPTVFLWKGAGDALLLSMAFFLMTLVAVTRFVATEPISSNWGRLSLIGSLNFIAVFSSSQVTLIPLMLVPHGMIVILTYGARSLQWVRFRQAALLSLLISACYWLMRRYIAGVHLPTDPILWDNIIGSFQGAIEVYFHHEVSRSFAPVVIATGSALVIFATLLSRRQPRSPVHGFAALWYLGVTMFLLGVLQLVGARHMTYAQRFGLSGYHLYLAYWGIGYACLAAVLLPLNYIWSLILRLRPAIRISIYCACASGAAALSTLYVGQQIRHLHTEHPLATSYPLQYGAFPYPQNVPTGISKFSVIQTRRQFFEDLRALISAHATHGDISIPLPNLPLTASPSFADLALWPNSIDGPAWNLLSSLAYLRRFAGDTSNTKSPVKFEVWPEELEHQYIRLQRQEYFKRFYGKYWPNQTSWSRAGIRSW